ncbi:hypothetical protein Gp_63 [Bacillus phage vB_Bacillus_1020A]|uniref:hypothetical protein n=1 Tax=Robertmurraya sp. DFI.2.37 TaxID=3031819 RepID=UPI0012468EB1|nr:hypothetical protein [Robertmurraya sp. DFI.2.37]MDF1511068.1 hypothetical protein [Robertmurraya sp. DFI.2.37]QIW89337.1 hypothetical protein Gp_63 [Bacillus phage vB_Bacillus_1020A]
MFSLSEHIKETIDRVDGYQTGTLVVEGLKVSLLQSDNTEIQLDESYVVEVRNGNEYMAVTIEQCIGQKTKEGWPLLAGLYARVKKSYDRKYSL